VGGSPRRLGRPSTRLDRRARPRRRAGRQAALLLLLAGGAVLARGPVVHAAGWRVAGTTRVEQAAPPAPPAEWSPSPRRPADEVVDLGATVWAPGEAAR